jgi:hypothetical protein
VYANTGAIEMDCFAQTSKFSNLFSTIWDIWICCCIELCWTPVSICTLSLLYLKQEMNHHNVTVIMNTWCNRQRLALSQKRINKGIFKTKKFVLKCS